MASIEFMNVRNDMDSIIPMYLENYHTQMHVGGFLSDSTLGKLFEMGKKIMGNEQVQKSAKEIGSHIFDELRKNVGGRLKMSPYDRLKGMNSSHVGRL